MKESVVTGSEVAVKVQHSGVCKPFSACGVAGRVSHIGSCLPRRVFLWAVKNLCE